MSDKAVQLSTAAVDPLAIDAIIVPVFDDLFAVHGFRIMKQMSAFGWALAILTVAIGSSAAQVPDGSGFVQCTTSSGYITGVTCNGGTDSGQVTYAPFAGVSGSAFGEGLVEEAGVFGVLNYSFEVTGGTAGDVVPVDVDTTLQAIPNSIGYVFSEIGVTANTSAGLTICSSGCGAGVGETGFTGVLQVSALSGTIYTDAIHLEIDVIGALGGTSDFDGGMASADPYIFVPPAYASEYSIEVSPNIGNVPMGTVPEPATWAMLLVGLAALAGLRYHREAAHSPQSPLEIA
jgi:hypothetical protein